MTLIGHWPLNDASGTTAVATVGSDGTYANAPTLHALGPGGVYPHGVKFAAASSQSATFPLSGLTDPWSVTFWFASTDTTADLFDWRDGAGDGVLLSLSSGALRADVNAGNRTAAANVDDGLAHHAVLTYDNGTATLYVDGVSDGTFAATDIAVAAANATIASGLDGRLSDVRTYSHALSPAEVLSIYEEARGPIAHYELDETSGTQLNDSSGNGLHLTESFVGYGTLDLTQDSVLGPTGGNIARAVQFESDPASWGAQSFGEYIGEFYFGRAGDAKGALSISAWLKVTGPMNDYMGRGHIVGNRGASFRQGAFRLGCNSADLTSDITLLFEVQVSDNVANDGIRVESPTVLEQDRWYHVVCTYDGNLSDTGMKIYLNAFDDTDAATQEGDTFAGWTPDAIAGKFYIGGRANFVGFTGQIARVKIWSRELTASEIDAIYQEGVGTGTGQTWDVTTPAGAVGYAAGVTFAGAAANITIDATISAASALAPTIAASAANITIDATISAASALAPTISAGTPSLTFSVDASVCTAAAQPLTASGSAATWQCGNAESQSTAAPPSISGAMGGWVVAAAQSAATAQTPAITSTSPSWDIPQAAAQGIASAPTVSGSPVTWQTDRTVTLASAVTPGFVTGAAWAPDQATSIATANIGTFTGTGDLIAPELRRHVVAARRRSHVIRR